MKNVLLTILTILISISVFAQQKRLERRQHPVNQSVNTINPGNGESQQSVIDKRPKPPISDYKIISVKNDTTFVDTTLSITKDYKFNYLRKDNFGLLPFSNVGLPYTRLAYSFDKVSLMPKFGARATHFAFLGINDIHYYHVPTPWTRLFFKTTFNQGQLLDAFFTSNISPQFNFSIAYKGLHSLGKYQHLMTSQGSFRATVNYLSKSKRYGLKAHFVSQNLSAQQNGGLTDLARQQFLSNSSQFRNRSVLDVKFTDANDVLQTKRFFVKHHYDLISGSDSTANNQLRLGHVLNLSHQDYKYNQDNAFALFGPAYQTKIRDEVKYQAFSNTLFARYKNNILGDLLFKVRQTDYNYGYNRKLYLDDGIVPNRLKGDIFAVGASYKKRIGGFEVSGDAMLNISGDFEGNYIVGKAAYTIDSLNKIEVSLITNSHRPNYDFLLYQSGYKNYNWRNDFDNVQKQVLSFRLRSRKIANLSVDYTRIHNYAYFGLKDNLNASAEADTLVTPFQYDGDINYLKIKAERQFDYWRFSLSNTLLFQDVVDGDGVFRVPSFVTRNSFYYKDYWFHDNLYLQTGFTLNYFSSFKTDAYDAVMAEFYVQNFNELEGFARLDFFFNAKIRQTRIFFTLENLTSIFDGNGHFAAPYYPYRDWVIRFGLVWDFFL